MNVYGVNEDGDKFCMKGRTMTEVIEFCESIYLQEREEELAGEFDEEQERRLYHEQILLSCRLLSKPVTSK